MVKSDFNFDTPKCAMCSQLASEIHELIGGRSHKKGNSDRDTCIKYHIQLPLCREHHNEFEATKKSSFIIGCEILGINNYDTYMAIHEHDEVALIKISEQCKIYYKDNYGVNL